MSSTGRDTGGARRAGLWFRPVVASPAGTFALITVRPEAGSPWATAVWPGGEQASSTTPQVVATSVMTATTLMSSVTALVLRPASQQFSPRLLRESARDPRTQAVLATLASTVVVSSTGLRDMGTDEPLPVLVPALALGPVSAGVLLMLLGHIVRPLRVDSTTVAVHEEAAATVTRTCLLYDDRSQQPARERRGPGPAPPPSDPMTRGVN